MWLSDHKGSLKARKQKAGFVATRTEESARLWDDKARAKWITHKITQSYSAHSENEHMLR